MSKTREQAINDVIDDLTYALEHRNEMQQPEHYVARFNEARKLPASPFDYIAETDKTASNVFSPENVEVKELASLLRIIISSTQYMDKFKKALFRKRSREEAGLDPFTGGMLLTTMPQLMNGGQEIHADLFHGIIGNITEVGEQAEILLSFLAGNRVDLVNVREEIGDNLWYLSRLCKYADTTIEQEMTRNIAKLRKRHGEGGFNKEADINRDLDAERKTLEGGE